MSLLGRLVNIFIQMQLSLQGPNDQRNGSRQPNRAISVYLAGKKFDPKQIKILLWQVMLFPFRMA